ncbi:hypothetical protein [Streptomyces sp. NPDC048442]|uniref:hypothetical protein n=1 Tax=Streptomyces sp. NPDC048442 TaxID=3154823 RepID=UPI003418DA87
MEPRTVAVAGVLVSVATGVVTNLVTERWSWTLGAALAVLVAVGAYLAVQASNGSSRRTRARQTARRGGRITRSGITASGDADAQQRADRDGQISNSPITARDSDADQRARDGGQITDSELDLGP